jgi:hypothetical protein
VHMPCSHARKLDLEIEIDAPTPTHHTPTGADKGGGKMATATADYTQPPPHLCLRPDDDDDEVVPLARLPRCLWTPPSAFHPEEENEETGGFKAWGVPYLVSTCGRLALACLLACLSVAR